MQKPDTCIRKGDDTNYLTPIFGRECPDRLAQEIDKIHEPPPTDWIVEGYIGKGLITEMVGFWKAGKTTMLAKEMQEGGTMAGRAVKKARGFVISEEGGGEWKGRQRRMGLGDNPSRQSRTWSDGCASLKASHGRWRGTT